MRILSYPRAQLRALFRYLGLASSLNLSPCTQYPNGGQLPSIEFTNHLAVFDLIDQGKAR